MLQLEPAQRQQVWQTLLEIVEQYLQDVQTLPVTPQVTATALRQHLEPFDFQTPCDPVAALQFVAQELRRAQIHTPHPGYFGLFNPAPTTMGIAADTLVAAFNPQLATWVHSPFAIEVERHLIQQIGQRFGYPLEKVEGTFASGGAEANHTALLTALVNRFPDYLTQGTRGLSGQPVFYISCEGHHSFLKAARLCGLGSVAVREIPLDGQWRLRLDWLREQLRHDVRDGHLPFLLVGTAGTTSGGIIDPLPELAALARSEKLWFHVDAAWGGAAMLVPELRPHLAGIEQADSITFDAHKWLSVPMGGAMYLTQRRGILEKTFRVAATYMPDAAPVEERNDPYATSIQWSRRFIGLKVFLSLAVAGWEGYAAALRHMTAMGNQLRQMLTAAGWQVVNPTPLPVVCFTLPDAPRGAAGRKQLEQLTERLLALGKSWISVTVLGGDLPVLRACITNYRTQPEDLRQLLQGLRTVRDNQ
jgi:glutamate/tyrosine decarboxylase-like PLP-dependent enzyme